MWHSPAKEGERQEWRRRGGVNRSNKARAKKELPAEPLSVAELHAYLGVVFRRVITGATEPGVATAAATVARTMAELAKTGDLEERLESLERRLGSRAS
jgi:hypothetical protein